MFYRTKLIKVNNGLYGASLHIDGPLDCPDQGPGGQKAILTSCNDDTTGEIFCSNGSPQPGEYGPALEVNCDDGLWSLHQQGAGIARCAVTVP